MDFCEDTTEGRTKKVKLLFFIAPCRPFRFEGYTYLTLHVMEEDMGEYVAIELTPKQQTVCVCVCVCVFVCYTNRGLLGNQLGTQIGNRLGLLNK